MKASMKLTDLEPEWLNEDVFIFKNPKGGEDWLTCKRVPMSSKEQRILFYGNDEPLDGPLSVTKWPGKSIVGTKPDCVWKFDGNDFATLTVTPSIDASASGNWHGFITNGEIR